MFCLSVEAKYDKESSRGGLFVSLYFSVGAGRTRTAAIQPQRPEKGPKSHFCKSYMCELLLLSATSVSNFNKGPNKSSAIELPPRATAESGATCYLHCPCNAASFFTERVEREKLLDGDADDDYYFDSAVVRPGVRSGSLAFVCSVGGEEGAPMG